MPNDDSPRGFVPLRHLSGGTIRLDSYPIATGYNTGIFKGDVVKLLNDGTIASCAATERALGVFQGCSYVDAQGNQVYSKYWPASTTATKIAASVVTDPNVVYLVQEVTGGTGLADAVGEMADHVVGTGDTATGISRSELSSTNAAGIALCRILAIHPAPSNVAGEHVNYEVVIYEHEFNEHAAAGTPGV